MVIAYLLTIVTNCRHLVPYGGLAIGSAWCFLLAIVTGWLMVSPKCNARQNSRCLKEVNAITHIAPEHIAEQSNIQTVCIENDPSRTNHRAFELIEEPDNLLRDQMSSQPLYNYARYYIWTDIARQVHYYYRNAHYQRFHGLTVHGGLPDRHDDVRNRLGTLSQVINYCEEDKYTPTNLQGGRSDDWFIACGLALLLQWGTIGAAILVEIMTPTTGLGCRSLASLTYGSVATFVWMLFLTSSRLTYQVQLRTQLSESSTPHTKLAPNSSTVNTIGGSARVLSRTVIYRFLAISFRRIAKVLAGINAMGFLTICFVEFTGKFDTCYCNSSVTGRGADRAYNLVLWKDGTVATRQMRNGFVGGVVLSLMCSAGFIIFLRSRVKPKRFSDPKLSA
ncbi:hypothetical protein DL96DRAFT_1713669 [Flagelloscypha sp. PMI_526]|nr:hypothetical protein DL96DRAFT_1713669 [Flagelloscypha sp. PMI_526]